MGATTKKLVKVSDKMQSQYVYELTAPVGRSFAPDFKPELTPQAMLALGVFGGVYMRDCHKEFPASWFKKAKFAPLELNKSLADINYFKVNASQPLSVWRQKGWIYKEDPRGWFQWYCRYYLGRRLLDEDRRQINRWKKMRRHAGQIVKNCRPKDTNCRPRQKQALLHWAYDSRRY